MLSFNRLGRLVQGKLYVRFKQFPSKYFIKAFSQGLGIARYPICTKIYFGKQRSSVFSLDMCSYAYGHLSTSNAWKAEILIPEHYAEYLWAATKLGYVPLVRELVNNYNYGTLIFLESIPNYEMGDFIFSYLVEISQIKQINSSCVWFYEQPDIVCPLIDKYKQYIAPVTSISANCTKVSEVRQTLRHLSTYGLVDFKNFNFGRSYAVDDCIALFSIHPSQELFLRQFSHYFNCRDRIAYYLDYMKINHPSFLEVNWYQLCFDILMEHSHYYPSISLLQELLPYTNMTNEQILVLYGICAGRYCKNAAIHSKEKWKEIFAQRSITGTY